MTKEKINEFTLKISNANKTEMIAILYDIAITYINDAIKALDDKDFKGFRNEIDKARRTIRELMDSVDTSVDLGLSLLKLYVYAQRELTKAYLNYEEGPLLSVMSMFSRLEESYLVAGKKDFSGPVMEHTEAVYNGFTYNKNLMGESVIGNYSNRGFLV